MNLDSWLFFCLPKSNHSILLDACFVLIRQIFLSNPVYLLLRFRHAYVILELLQVFCSWNWVCLYSEKWSILLHEWKKAFWISWRIDSFFANLTKYFNLIYLCFCKRNVILLILKYIVIYFYFVSGMIHPHLCYEQEPNW